MIMLSKKLEDALNEQIRNEFFSHYAYLAMSAYCDSRNLPGFALWLRAQAAEEMTHAMKIFDFVLDREGEVLLKALEQPEHTFGSVQEVFQKALDHERFISRKINELYELAKAENDYPTQVMLQWFITEQVEEEKTATDILAQIKMVADDKSALFLLDKEMGTRRPETAPA